MKKSASDRIRLTISVTPEVHAQFKRLADASGGSLSWAMGEWLSDTIEAVTFTASKMEQAKQAPRVVLHEMQTMALGLAENTAALMASLATATGAGDGKRSAAPAPEQEGPPPSNTGGKVPTRRRSKSSSGQL